jgi:hypothetical protein
MTTVLPGKQRNKTPTVKQGYGNPRQAVSGDNPAAATSRTHYMAACMYCVVSCALADMQELPFSTQVVCETA